MKRLLLAAALCASATPAFALFDTAAPGWVYMIDPTTGNILGSAAHPLNVTGGGGGGGSTTPFVPGSTAISPFTATGVSSTISIPAGSTTLIVSSSSATSNIAHCTLGAGPAVTSDQTIQPGASFAFNVTAATQFSCITSAGSQVMTAVAGSGALQATAAQLTTGTGSNASVGPTGSVAPTSSTYDGMLISGGNMVGASGSVWGSAPTGLNVLGVNADILSSVLPTGAATATNQEVTAAGTSAASAQGVQGVTGGVPFLTNPGTATLWGILTQGSTTSGQSGQLMMGAVTTAAPSYTTAQTSPLSLDPAGNLRVNVVTGGGSGGTSAADKSAFTYGTTTMTTGGCVFNSSITQLTSGQAGGVSCSANREQYFDVLQTSNFYTLLSATTGTPGSAIPSQGNMVGGTDGTNFRDMGVDAANNVKTATAANITPTDCSGTITTGGTAQPAIAAQTTLHGFTIANIDASAGSGEPLWLSFTTTAAAATAASYPLAPPAATTFAGMGSYSTPPGFGTNHAVSIIGATTGHKFSCSWW
jgi:hypothetical protein